MRPGEPSIISTVEEASPLSASGQNPPTELTIRRLEQQLRAARAAYDTAWEDGYRTSQRDQNLDIPDELSGALRHGSAQEHIHIPIGDDQLTVVLAHDGSGHPRRHLEAQAWESLQNVHRKIVNEARPAVTYLRHVEMPRPIAAVIRRSGDDVAVVVNRAVSRAHFKTMLRDRSIRVTGWTLAAIAGWAIGRQVVRGAPMVAIAAVTAAITAVAMPGISHTAPRPTASAPGKPGTLADDGSGVPSGKPLATPPDRNAGPSGTPSAPPNAGIPAVPAETTPPQPGKSKPPKARKPYPVYPPGGDQETPTPKHHPHAHRHGCHSPRILRLIAAIICGRG